MRARELLRESKLLTDVPNDDWLRSKIEYAKKRGKNSFGVPHMGSITGYYEGPIKIPVSILSRIPGQRAEQTNVRHKDLEAIKDIMKKTGKLPLTDDGKEYVPYIEVAYDGSAWVSEGNHRIMAAKELGWDSLPVEIRYFDGGERVENGPLYPRKIN